MIKPTYDNSVMVDTSYNWISTNERKPVEGAKVLMISPVWRVAHIGFYTANGIEAEQWWAPLPSFKENHE